MKRVSFKVARALKDAGYPQPPLTLNNCYGVNGNNPTMEDLTYHHGFCCYKPTYLEVWLWLWREKKACIGILFDDGDCTVEIRANKSFLRDFDSRFDPEEAIKSAIEYLVDNDLIK